MEEALIIPRKLFVLIFLTLAATGFAATTPRDIYFAQNAAGSNNGSSCSNAYAYNDPTNGISKSVNWVAGNTLHVCGTISVNAGQNIISAQGSGTSSSPITIKFEPGAILQSSAFGTGSSAGIVLSGYSYITIDGGNSGNATGGTTWTGGLIQNYANGSAGQNNCPGISNNYSGACTNQANPTTLIESMGSNNITIENLGPCVVAVVTSGSFSNGAPGADCIHFQGTNVTITNNQIWYAGTGIDNTEYGSDNNTVISNNDFQQNGWGIGCAGGTHVNTNYQIFGNHFHNFTQWNTTGAHVNGIHCYGAQVGGTGTGGIASLYLYNNLFDGPMGSGGWTSWVYLEADGPQGGSVNNWVTNNGTLYAFNNILVATGTVVNGNGMLNFGGGANHIIANNYFYGSGINDATGTGPCMDFQGQGITVVNNVFENCNQILAGPFGGNPGPTFAQFDYNIYANMSNNGNGIFTVNVNGGNNINTNNFSTWQSECGCDTHSQAQLASPLSNITNEGVPSQGYVGLNEGANLSSTATGNLAALALDTSAGNTRTPTVRPVGSCSSMGSSSCWDVAAYELTSSGTSPEPPTGLAAVVQ